MASQGDCVCSSKPAAMTCTTCSLGIWAPMRASCSNLRRADSFAAYDGSISLIARRVPVESCVSM